jgi:hypothetical protein
MAHAGLKVGYDYYKNKYNEVGGELYFFKQAFMAATVYNPFNLAEYRPSKCKLFIGELAHFGFPEFTAPFLEQLKAELSALQVHARRPYEWNLVPGAKEYDKKLERRLKKEGAKLAAVAVAPAMAAAAMAPAVAAFPAHEPDEEDGNDESPRALKMCDWKDDPIEKARRMWEWWRERVSMFKSWPLALRLVALVQPSSAVMERAFSQLKLTLEIIGYSSLEKVVEARMFVRLNAGVVN